MEFLYEFTIVLLYLFLTSSMACKCNLYILVTVTVTLSFQFISFHFDADGRNFILTSHLGLQIPSESWIKVGDQTRQWEVGKLLTLDTSFQHSTGNPSDTDRYVLIIDFWHPDLNEAERAGLEFVYNLRNQFESGKIPVRPPRGTLPSFQNKNKQDENEEEGQGLMGVWNSLFKGEN